MKSGTASPAVERLDARNVLRFAASVILIALAQLSSGQVINMSRDLVALGIATENLRPNSPTLDARPLLQAAVAFARNHATQVLTLDKGDYYLLTPQASYATLQFEQLAGLTVDFAGSTIYFKGPLLPNGLQAWDCKNFTLKNLNIDYLVPPYTHVRLVEIDAERRILRYEPMPGWRDPVEFNNVGAIFGEKNLWLLAFRNGRIVPGTTRSRVTPPITGNSLELVQDGTPWTQAAALASLQPGDTLVVTIRGGGPPVQVMFGDGNVLTDVSIFGSPTWAVQFYGTSNSTAENIYVGPRPSGGLVGSNADGIHFASARQNNHIRNSRILNTMDDALAIDNLNTALITSVTGARQVRVKREGALRFPNGTAMNFVDPNTTTELTGATIVWQSPPDSSAAAPGDSIDVTFDRDLPFLFAGMGMVYAADSMRGGGSTVEDNEVEDTFGGRGLWISGARGVVAQRNTIRRTSLSGISVYQATDPAAYAVPGPPAHDIVIRNNVIDGVPGPAADGDGAQNSLASITVVSLNNQQFGFATAASNSNVSILNNVIIDSGRSAIYVGELNAGTVDGNQIWRHYQQPDRPIWGVAPQYQAQVRLDFQSAIVVRNSDGIAMLNNPSASAPRVKVIEYYNAALDHYFIAAESQPDVPALDSGAIVGWSRTGFAFNATAGAEPGKAGVCRFYIPPAKGNSHFYSAASSECSAIYDAAYTPANPAHATYVGFVYETGSAFFVEPVTRGACAPLRVPVWRLWNGRVDTNHRYTTDLGIRDEMIARGYVDEGVVMCALR